MEQKNFDLTKLKVELTSGSNKLEFVYNTASKEYTYQLTESVKNGVYTLTVEGISSSYGTLTITDPIPEKPTQPTDPKQEEDPVPPTNSEEPQEKDTNSEEPTNSVDPNPPDCDEADIENSLVGKNVCKEKDVKGSGKYIKESFLLILMMALLF